MANEGPEVAPGVSGVSPELLGLPPAPRDPIDSQYIEEEELDIDPDLIGALDPGELIDDDTIDYIGEVVN